jgi:hypothetical protein
MQGSAIFALFRPTSLANGGRPLPFAKREIAKPVFRENSFFAGHLTRSADQPRFDRRRGPSI